MLGGEYAGINAGRRGILIREEISSDRYSPIDGSPRIDVNEDLSPE